MQAEQKVAPSDIGIIRLDQCTLVQKVKNRYLAAMLGFLCRLRQRQRADFEKKAPSASPPPTQTQASQILGESLSLKVCFWL